MRALCMLAFVAGCSAPNFGNGHLQCASSGRSCPSGFYCAPDDHCWRLGTAPTPPTSDVAASIFDFATPPSGDLGTAGDLAVIRDLATADVAVTPSKCAGLNVLLCDGFEAAMIDPQWLTPTSLATLTIDTSRAYRGRQSLHMHHDATSTASSSIYAVVQETKTFPISGTIYFRAWMFFSSSSFPPNEQPILVDSGAGAGVTYLIDHGHPGVNDYATPSTYSASATTSIPSGRWTCLQMDITQTGASGTINVSLDGTLVDVSPVSGTTPTVAFVDFGMNLYMPPALPAEDIWLDEVIVDNKPTTCAE